MAGEAILANIVTEILKKLGSFALKEINLSRGVKKELEKLQKTILMIEAVISDAEYKQVKEKSVGIWLKELKDLAYEADDILDEFAYDLMHQRQGLDSKRDKVRNFISISSNPIARSSKMGHEIKDLNQKFDELAKQRVGLGLQTIGVGSSSHTMSVDGSHGINRETYAFVDESKVIGRDVDKSNIINMLLANKSSCNQNDKISVIPIVGMGGLGKTTLAQFVYKDTLVESHFNLKSWVCVSDVFDLKKIFLNITKSIPVANIDAGSDLNFIVNQLQQHLRGKRFLLVLDDLWNEIHGEWDKLKDPLMVGAEGSKILVTTRSEKVASIVLAGEFSSYKLQSLGDDICLCIFEQRAFGPPSCKAIKTPTLVEIGKELVRKCGGLPLAAEALGSLMRSKKEVSEWEVIRDSEIWESNSENSNEILPALKLSYDHLSPQVKPCFAYCSLYPKDSLIERETLIRLWVAEGFIQPFEGDERLMEEIGHGYFNNLLCNSLFQGVHTNEDGEITSCKMHDLIHDLAQSVAGTHECKIMEASEVGDISEIRRLNLLNVNEGSTVVSKSSKLRTLFIECERNKNIANYGRLFNSHKKLRVLDLSSHSGIEELPPSIGDLKHLRYLDLSGCRNLKKLPDSIIRLYNLQTLILKGCRNLKKYPKDLNRLINLRHLCYQDMNDWQDQVGQLTCLQTLMNGFGVGGIEGSRVHGIGQLQCLNFLRGKLEITGLERVKGGGEENANLKAKKFIKQLTLSWGDEDEEEKYNNASLVLEGLQPHPNLRTLTIFDFMGPNFPTWLSCSSSNPSSSCLPNLVHLEFFNCNRCKQLPALLGVLPSLRFLHLQYMSLLEEWLDQPSSSSSYPSLESIKILWCPNLKSIPTIIFSLKEFYVVQGGTSIGMGVSSIVRSNLDTLTELVINDVGGLEFLPLGLLKDNNVLQTLFISHCPDFQGFNHREGVVVGDKEGSSDPVLQNLFLYHCPVLRLLPDLKDLTSLQNVTIQGCNEELGNIVTEILKKLGSFALEEINLARGVKKEVEKLKKTILMIEAVISDAENKQVKEEAVGICLKKLKDIAYKADGILDKYPYDLLMHQQRQGFNLERKRDKVWNFISSSSSNFGRFARSLKMGHEIKDLNQKFDDLARQRVGLGLQQTIDVGLDFSPKQQQLSSGCNEDLVISLPNGVENRLKRFNNLQDLKWDDLKW